MKKIFLALCDFIFNPFYGLLTGFPFGLKVGHHPFYKQMQFLHFRLTRDFRKKEEPRQIILPQGRSFTLLLSPGADFLQNYLFMTGIYETDLTHRMTTEIKSCETFVDVGAHIGYYSLLAKKLKSTISVFAFEPQPELYEILQKNIKINVVDVNTFCFALGSDNEMKVIHTGRFPEQASLLGPNGSALYKKETVVKRCDHVLNAKNNTICIKIDTEGFEFEVLEGMQQLLQENRCTVFIEYHGHMYEKYFTQNYTVQKLELWKKSGYLFFYATGKRKGQEFRFDSNLKDRPVLEMRRVT